MRDRKRKADVVIIGGGASGLAAAIELGMRAPQLSVLVIEKMPEPARKIRATGSGRCNIMNTGAEGFSRIMSFFRETGLVTRTYEDGLVYPYSESAADVAELLVKRAEALGVKLACGEEVISVKTAAEAVAEAGNEAEAGDEAGRFIVTSVFKGAGGEQRITTAADYAVLACGGKAGPSYGTTGDGYRLARELGHSIVTPVPALTGIECREWDEGEEPCGITLGGTRSRGVVSLYRDSSGGFGEETKLFEEAGEIQFTKYGLSGICVFNMTRFMRFDKAAGESLDDFLIRLDLFPDGSIAEYIEDRQKGAFADAGPDELLCTILKKPLAAYAAGRYRAMRASEPGDDDGGRDGGIDIQLMQRAVHGLEFHPVRLRGWKDAQVTMGGVSLDEIDGATSESKLAEGLYITGELADRDFMCGGFNLSNAWLTGLAAADDIAGRSR